MDYKKAIEVLANEIGCVDLDTNNRGYIDESEQKFMDACNTAISAMEELQEYHKTGLSFKQVADTIFELGATKRVLGHYQQLGTLEEVWEALEKAERYHWHDLRKNPDDIPSGRNMCMCFAEGDFVIEDGSVVHGKYPVIIPFPFSEYEYRCNFKVVAWREIEPFEED